MRKMSVLAGSSVLGSLVAAACILLWQWFHSPPPPEPVPKADIVLPAQVQADPGRLVEIAADTVGDVVRWAVLDAPNKADYREQANGHTLLFVASTPGQYQLLAWTAIKGTATSYAQCLVIVGKPGPGPPPAPTDALTQALVAAYRQDADADKAKSVAFLASIYAGAATSIANDPNVKTNADALAALKEAIHAPGLGIADAAVTHVRRAIADYLNSTLGTKPGDPVNRVVLGSAFAAIGKALSEVKS